MVFKAVVGKGIETCWYQTMFDVCQAEVTHEKQHDQNDRYFTAAQNAAIAAYRGIELTGPAL
jgi:hypothetical protein